VTPPVAPNTAFLSAFTNATGAPGTVGAFVDASAVNLSDIGNGMVRLTAFNVPGGSTVNPATGSYSGSGISVQDRSFPNALSAYWGIWFDGSATDATGITTFLSAGKFFHYLVGPNTPPEVVSAKRGTFAFDLVPGTLSASNNLGEAVAPITGRIAVIDFDKRTLAFDPIRFLFPTQTWTFSATGPSPINVDARGAFVQTTATGACTSAASSCNGAARLDSTAIIMGPGADHLGHSFQAKTTSGIPASMQGTAISTCNPPCR
jgi:hypothetical protein